MCDYGIHSIKSRPTKTGDMLFTRNFGRAQEDSRRGTNRASQSAYYRKRF
jgi:hypothetical protein